jgi:integrase
MNKQPLKAHQSFYVRQYMPLSEEICGAKCGAGMAALSDRAARNIEPGVTLREGTVKGLTLIGGSRKGEGKWNLRFQIKGRRRDMGLGAFPDVGVAAARLAGMAARAEIARGIDPIAAREARNKANRPIPTFREIAAGVISEKQANTKNEKVRYQIARHLGPDYSGPLLDRPVNEITTMDVAAVLWPIWRTKPEVARKLRPAISDVFKAARVRLRDQHGITFDNPAAWDDLKALGFESPKALSKGHYPSLPYQRMPEFMAALRERETITARMLEFLILTNVRTSTVIDAEWREIDLDAALWIVPLEHLKDEEWRKEPFRIPLSQRALEILRQMDAARVSQYVFPNAGGKSFSDMAMLALIKRMNRGETKWIDPTQNRRIVVHGFRASFKTWGKETAHFPDSFVEEAMGHAVGSAVERAYSRTDLLKQRQSLMQAWANHCEPKAGNILNFSKSGGQSA